jgi:hypothetical protein
LVVRRPSTTDDRQTTDDQLKRFPFGPHSFLLDRVKKLLVLAVASLLAIAVLELGAAQLYARYRQRPLSRAEIAGRLIGGSAAEPTPAQAQAVTDPRVADQPVILHPYFGYVANPTKPRVNRFGFYGREPFSTRAPDVALVGIFGGSVADQLVKLGGDALVAALGAGGPLAGRRIELINLALGGYKQPQQLLVLATLLAFGAQFDAVINLDGFNEIDGATDNLQDGINPFYPYTWNLHARQALDSGAMVHMAKADIIRGEREQLRGWFARWPVPHSAFLLTWWDFLDQRQEAALRAETAALRDALTRSAATPQQTGPAVRFADDEGMYREYAEVWARASLAMHLLCSGYGIRYFHFLQPNQYLPGSKELTSEELETAFDPEVAETARVAAAYPILTERGADLREQGVDFFNLTMLFKDEPRSMYGDTCCHYNRLGNERVAEAVAKAIADASEPPPEPVAEPEAPADPAPWSEDVPPEGPEGPGVQGSEPHP